LSANEYLLKSLPSPTHLNIIHKSRSVYYWLANIKQASMAFTRSEILEALKQCNFVAETAATDLLRDAPLDCSLERSIIFSTKLALVRRNQRFGTYVIFRGTESRGLGTWFITNFQAASTPFHVIDDEIHHHGRDEAPIPIQGCTLKLAAPGRVHQGFLRTWSQLWYGSEILVSTFVKPASPWGLMARYASLAMITAAIGMYYQCDTVHVVLLTAVAVLFSMALESGSLERLVRTRTRLKGVPVLKSLKISRPEGPLWFVGHSMGGALATLAFTAYRSRCEELGVNSNARLVTFGAPQIGDATFVSDFEGKHSGNFIHIAHKSDPVTMSPPARLSKLLHVGFPLLGLWGPFLLITSLFWQLVYSVFWGQKPYATWSTSHGLCCLGGRYNWITLFRHTRKSYAKHLPSANFTDG
jgi:Lipase (class 3)